MIIYEYILSLLMTVCMFIQSIWYFVLGNIEYGVGFLVGCFVAIVTIVLVYYMERIINKVYK